MRQAKIENVISFFHILSDIGSLSKCCIPHKKVNTPTTIATTMEQKNQGDSKKRKEKKRAGGLTVKYININNPSTYSTQTLHSPPPHNSPALHT